MHLVFLTWYQSYCFDIFLAVLSLLVLLHSLHRFCRHNSFRSLLPLSLCSRPAATIVEESYTAQTIARVITTVNIATIKFLQISLRSFCTDLHIGGSLEAIGDSMRPHALPKDSAPKLTHSTRFHLPIAFFTCLDVLARARSAPTDVNPR